MSSEEESERTRWHFLTRWRWEPTVCLWHRTSRWSIGLIDHEPQEAECNHHTKETGNCRWGFSWQRTHPPSHTHDTHVGSTATSTAWQNIAIIYSAMVFEHSKGIHNRASIAPTNKHAIITNPVSPYDIQNAFQMHLSLLSNIMQSANESWKGRYKMWNRHHCHLFNRKWLDYLKDSNVAQYRWCGSLGLQTGKAGVAPRGMRGRDHPLRWHSSLNADSHNLAQDLHTCNSETSN